MSLVIRIVVENGNPKERLLSVSEAEDKSGNGTAFDIISSLESNNIDTKKLAFQSYDFAASMSGKYNGTQRKISEIVNRSIPYIPCQAHKTNTALEHCCNASSIMSELFTVLAELYVFFHNSSKKLQGIEDSLLLKNSSKTRWTARADTLQAVNTSFEKILDLLNDISNDNSNFDRVSRGKALALIKSMSNFDFICCH